MSKLKRFIAFAFVVIWIVVIYLFSNMPSTESNGKSQKIISLTIEKTLSVTNSLEITNKHPSKQKINNVAISINKPLRKCMHASIYFILGILIFELLKICKLSKDKIYISTIMYSFLYACMDEFHQLFIVGRTGQFSDVLIDTFGAIIGMLFINVVLRINKRIDAQRIIR